MGEGVTDFRLCAVDATVISEPRSTGTDWRLHYMLEMPSLTCRYFELTDVRGGESFSRFPAQAGDLLVGDRGYAGAAAVKSVQKKGGEVIVRVRPHGSGMRTPEDAKVSGRACVYRLDANTF